MRYQIDRYIERVWEIDRYTNRERERERERERLREEYIYIDRGMDK